MTRWPGRLALCALCAAPAGWAADYAPLPSACDILDRIDARGLAGIGPEAGDNIEMALQERAGIRLSGCSLPSAGAFGYGLTLREDTAPDRPPGPEQIQDIFRQYAEVWGTELEAKPVEVGDAAVWVAEMNQLWVIARDGHAYMVFSVPEGAGPDKAAEFAATILSSLD